MEKKKGDGRRQPSKRRRIIVGQAAVSEVASDPYDDSVDQHVETRDHSHLQDPQYDFPRGNRRIREAPSTIQPRQQAVLADGRFAPAALRSMDPLGEVLAFEQHLRERSQGILDASARASMIENPLTLQRTLSDPLLHSGQGSAVMNNPFLSQGIARFRPSFFPPSPLPDTTNGLGSLDGYACVGLRASALQAPPVSHDMIHQLLGLRNAPPSEDAEPAERELGSLADTISAAQRQHSQNGSVLSDHQESNSPQDMIRRLLATRNAPTTEERSVPEREFVSLAGSIFSVQEQRHNQAIRDEDEGEGGERKRLGIAKFRQRNAKQEVKTPHSSRLVAEEQSTTQVELAPPKDRPSEVEAPKQHTPIRFFNAGVEVHINGRPLPTTKSEAEKPPEAEKSPQPDQSKSKKQVSKRKKRTATDRAEEEKKREEELENLQERQRSVWDAFALDADDEQSQKKEDKTIDDRKRNPGLVRQQLDASRGEPEMEDPSSINLSPNTVTSVIVDDAVKKSLTKERQNTLSAASVLMALSPRKNPTIGEIPWGML